MGISVIVGEGSFRGEKGLGPFSTARWHGGERLEKLLDLAVPSLPLTCHLCSLGL